MNMLRPHDLWAIEHTHHPQTPIRPHGDFEPRTSARDVVLGRRRRRRLAALAAVPALALIASCGAGDSAASAYCGAVEDAKPAFVALQSGDPGKFEVAFAAFHRLAQDSPSALDADWKVLDRAITGVEAALEAAGLDFAALAAGDLPDGIGPEELQALNDGLEGLASEDVSAAANSIEKHAFEECDVELAAG